ncbi:MAG: hypothetical protein LUQ65_05860, partial [Candidatus Helarchaeota archaeon]|nr:hypothetical protein [Candidatus Helarchaeota archaeon]
AVTVRGRLAGVKTRYQPSLSYQGTGSCNLNPCITYTSSSGCDCQFDRCATETFSRSKKRPKNPAIGEG